ncbi:MAG: zinc-binding dehydrogenase, partial [Bhargavaea sp.]
WGYFRKLHPEEVGNYHAALMELYKEGKIDPLVYGAYPFEQLPDALGKLSNRETYGKLLLKVGETQ